MSKIICDVCGTQYPESAEQCPICGYVRAAAGKTAADSIIMDEAQVPSRPHERGGHFSKSNVRKRNKNNARYDMNTDRGRGRADEGIEEDYIPVDNRKQSNTVLNILLVIVIIALLLVTGYIFVQYFLPNIIDQAETTVPAETVVETTEAPTEEPTEEPTVPCTGLELVNGDNQIVLTEIGQAWLLNLQATPADTTDVIVYTSSDENVALVDGQGCVTAVGEGNAVITAACGEHQVTFDVACFFVDASDPVGGEGDDPAEETEAPTEEPTEPLKDVTLAVTRTDLTFKMIGQQYTMRMDCDLTNKEVTWSSENEGIVTIDEDGIITCVGWGTTNVIAKYGDQEVEIICRCIR